MARCGAQFTIACVKSSNRMSCGGEEGHGVRRGSTVNSLAQGAPFPRLQSHTWAAPYRGGGRDALEGEGPQMRPQKRLGRRLEGVAKAVGGDYCRLQMPLKPSLGVRETVAGHGLGGMEGGGGGTSPPFQCIHGEGRGLAQGLGI